MIPQVITSKYENGAVLGIPHENVFGSFPKFLERAASFVEASSETAPSGFLTRHENGQNSFIKKEEKKSEWNSRAIFAGAVFTITALTVALIYRKEISLYLFLPIPPSPTSNCTRIKKLEKMFTDEERFAALQPGFTYQGNPSSKDLCNAFDLDENCGVYSKRQRIKEFILLTHSDKNPSCKIEADKVTAYLNKIFENIKDNIKKEKEKKKLIQTFASLEPIHTKLSLYGLFFKDVKPIQESVPACKLFRPSFCEELETLSQSTPSNSDYSKKEVSSKLSDAWEDIKSMQKKLASIEHCLKNNSNNIKEHIDAFKNWMSRKFARNLLPPFNKISKIYKTE